MSHATRWLVVDDDEIFRSRLARSLRTRGFEVQTAADAQEARTLAEAAGTPWDRVVVDLKMPGETGLELVAALTGKWPTMPVILLTGYASVPTAVQAMRAGAHDVLSKPARIEELIAAFDSDTAPPSTIDEEPPTPSLASVEWEHIHRVLADCDGNISEAARRLGMHRRSLQRKLAKYPPP